MTFDEVLPALLRVCETWDHASNLKQVAAVRDLRGRVRLAIEQHRADKGQLRELSERLTRELGTWFSETLCKNLGSPAERGIAAKVIDRAQPWLDPRYPDGIGGWHRATEGRWKILERRVGKHPWLAGDVSAPWPLSETDPTVVTFFSFKGGVGRTTTLAACALLAAEAGDDVVVIDLDLEAPGLASLFGVTPTRGVLDFLVDHVATGSTALDGLIAVPTGIPESLAERIRVIPAGALSAGYLEKLARLDFAASAIDASTESPVRAALGALIQAVRERLRPKWILLDARAGLHDLAGLSLHAMAHLDVLFSRANQQGYEGLAVVLQALTRATRTSAQRMVLVHAMAPPRREEAESLNARLRHKAHGLFKEHVYAASEAIPEESAPDADHVPRMVKRSEVIELNEGLDEVREALMGSDYRAVWERITMLAVPAAEVEA